VIQFLTTAGNLPFTTALALMLGIGALEGLSLLFGATLSSVLEHDSPVHLDADVAEIDAPGWSAQVLSWLHVGKVPMLMLLVIFLTAFGLIGLTLQALISGFFAKLLPAWLATIPALVLSLPVVRGTGGIVKRIMPRDETDTVSEDSFVGRVATITLGRATPGSPAQARLRDQHGTTHYVMVEPDQAEETFEAGQQVLLVRRQGALFRALAGTGTEGFKTVDY
jgi:hypothetical protein